MRIFILDKEKVTKFNLPNKISGVFAIEYLPVNSKLKRTVSIEAIDNKWYLKSNESINIIENNIIKSEVEIKEYYYLTFQIKGLPEIIGIYCIPSIEQNFYRYTLSNNNITIGSSQEDSICYQNNLVLPHHVIIQQKDDKNWYIQATKSETQKAYLNDVILDNQKLKIGDVLFLYGLKLIWMGNFLQINNPNQRLFINNFSLVNYVEQNVEDNTNIQPMTDEEMALELYNENDYFFHTPRLKQSLVEETIVIDAPPTHQEQEEMPFILTIGSTITMLSTSAMTGYTAISSIANGTRTFKESLPQLITCGTMLIGSIIMPRIISVYQKKQRKKAEKKRQKKYTEYVKNKENEINLKLVNQAQILRDNNISIQEVYTLAASKRTSAIWNREISDDDFLNIKVGIGNCPAKITISAPEKHFSLDEDNLEQMVIDVVSKLHKLDNVPITLSFTEKYISAFICNATYNDDFINGIILQLATFHSSQDLKLVFLLNNNTEAYEYAKFLPHCTSEDKSIRFFANTIEDIKYISQYLDTEFMNRKKEIYGKAENVEDERNLGKEINKEKAYKSFSPYYLIITNDYTNIKNIPIIKDIVETNNNIGFSLSIIDNSLQSLPNACKAFVELYDKESCIVEKDLNNQLRFNADIVQKMEMRQITNRLANIPIAYVDEASSLPTSMTFLEMYNVARIEQLNILNRWKTNDPTVSLKTPIGVHTSGELFELDLHEKFHGPHGLIAGSTGSGKSEFIITFLLSMAVNYHPDEVQFVLIDYKGGGLAGAFENRETNTRLPHVVGTITNLDTSEMNRTLVSINSELKRRQRMFNEAKGATGESTIDIYKYQHYYREGILDKPISHLFIVSDEFAELKSQQPEFMDELISTARIGRSLGVHLILATQKPSGVVNDQIWSNTKFRICLKVQDRGDSMEVLKKPDAASIKETGRFYLQVGYDEYFDIGQSGWAGAKYIPSDAVIKKVDDSIKFIDNVGKVTKVVNEITKKVQKEEKGDQLTNIVKHIISIAEDEEYKPQQLWLDKIPAEIFLGNLSEKYNYKPQPYIIEPIIGEYDNPAQQMQDLLKLNITDNNTLIYGMADSGKETLLATMIFSAIMSHSPDEINFYILDFGAETLKAFAKAPHIGEVCTINDEEKIMNLFIMIDKELDRRKELFVEYAGSYTNYCQNSGEKLPLINIVINNYEIFQENMGKMAELITTLYRDALKYGISFTIATGAANSFRARIAEYFSNKLCLQMANDTDYRNLLMCARGLIPSKISGRGITGIGDLKLEFQTAYITKQSEINKTIKESIIKLNETYKDHAKRVPVLPDVVTIEHILPDLKGVAQIPVGVDVDSKQTYAVDLTRTKINSFIYDNIANNLEFFYNFFSMIKQIPQTKIRLIDFNKEFDISKTPIDCYSSNFETILPAIIQEVKSSKTNPTTKIYIINGIGKAKEKIPDKTAIGEMLKEVQNDDKTILILTDNYEQFKLLQLETWFKEYINDKEGLWLGTGIGTQLIFKISNMTQEMRTGTFEDMAIGIENGIATPIKKLNTKKDEKDEK